MENIIIAPIITEKSIADAGKGKFTFHVAIEATKSTIKLAVAKAFSVHPVAVTTTTIKGRTKRRGARRIEQKISAWKKATVQLQSGEKISLFEVGEGK